MVLRGMAVAPGEQVEVAGIYQSQLSRTTFAMVGSGGRITFRRLRKCPVFQDLGPPQGHSTPPHSIPPCCFPSPPPRTLPASPAGCLCRARLPLPPTTCALLPLEMLAAALKPGERTRLTLSLPLSRRFHNSSATAP